MGYLIKNRAKSKNLLYPLLGIPRNSIIKDNMYRTFLYCSETDESVDDYMIFVLFEKIDFTSKEYQNFIDKYVVTNKNLSNCYHTDQGELYVFNFFDNREIIDLFLQGKYSKFSESDKKIILNFFNQSDIKKACKLIGNLPEYPHHVILYPNYYFELVAKELYEERDIELGVEYLKQIGELWEKYDYEIEFLECKITNNCVRNYDNMALKLYGS